jgi:hypothetical protein
MGKENPRLVDPVSAAYGVCEERYAVWTEENPSTGSNWFFVMPNVHGKRPDGTPFSGFAVRLTHGVAISWDGRELRHCTSVSMPDGPVGKRVGETRQKFRNNLFGTFTAAQEKIVAAGRALSAGAARRTGPQDGDAHDGAAANH